ncbi:MAG: hypothetical protein QW356_07650 [Candidatus Hadarchaeales archaeon]
MTKRYILMEVQAKGDIASSVLEFEYDWCDAGNLTCLGVRNAEHQSYEWWRGREFRWHRLLQTRNATREVRGV